MMVSDKNLARFRQYLNDFAEERRSLANMSSRCGDVVYAHSQLSAALTTKIIVNHLDNLLYAKTDEQIEAVFSAMQKDIDVTKGFRNMFAASGFDKNKE